MTEVVEQKVEVEGAGEPAMTSNQQQLPIVQQQPTYHYIPNWQRAVLPAPISVPAQQQYYYSGHNLYHGQSQAHAPNFVPMTQSNAFVPPAQQQMFSAGRRVMTSQSGMALLNYPQQPFMPFVGQQQIPFDQLQRRTTGPRFLPPRLRRQQEIEVERLQLELKLSEIGLQRNQENLRHAETMLKIDEREEYVREQLRSLTGGDRDRDGSSTERDDEAEPTNDSGCSPQSEYDDAGNQLISPDDNECVDEEVVSVGLSETNLDKVPEKDENAQRADTEDGGKRVVADCAAGVDPILERADHQN